MNKGKLTAKQLKICLARGENSNDIAIRYGMNLDYVRTRIRQLTGSSEVKQPERQDLSEVAPDSIIALVTTHGSRGVALEEVYEPPRKAKPTHHRIGSRARLEELAKRAERGEDLWNDQDAKEHEPLQLGERQTYRQRETNREPLRIRDDGRRVLGRAKY